ncbi:ABC transporter substrate-binding protein [Uliginosibacterium sp. H1]|uniref:ABC transporter substrate-binding protein n=1 Tax=Uliginosibacterium sp. H1 TaxID=3114757 RepID=UPI002E19C4D5|nr:ABC transporter substrate-binding protein [Uliginosibacterium sp. H1]
MKSTHIANSRRLRRPAFLGRLAAALGLVTTLAATALPAAAEAPPAEIRFAFASPKVGSPPQYTLGSAGIAFTKGWFEEEFKNDKTKIEFFFFKGAGPAVNEAFTNKQIDFAAHGDLPSVIGRAAGLKTRLLFANNHRNNIYLAVPPNSTLKSVKELKGKKVSFFKGTNSQTPINRLLRANGLTERDIRVVNLDTASGKAALLNGDIDALFGSIDLLTLRDEGKLKILYTSNGDSPIYTRQAHIHVDDEFATKYPETTKRIVKVLVKAAHWGSLPENRAEVLKLWAIPGVYTVGILEEDYGPDLKDRFSPYFDPFLVGRYKDVVKDALEYKLTRKTFDVEPWVDRSFLNAVLKEEKLEGFWVPLDVNGKPIKGAARGSAASDKAAPPAAKTAANTAAK